MLLHHFPLFAFGFDAWGMSVTGRTHWSFNYMENPWYPLENMTGDSWAVLGVVFTSAEGPVSTTWYEWSREGIDDLRYIEMLETLIKKVKKSGTAEGVKAAKESEKMLKEIEAQIPESLP